MKKEKKKKKIAPIATNVTTTEDLRKTVGTTNNVPSVETIEKAAENPASDSAQKAPIDRNLRKRETLKGTILQAVMMDKELLKKVKHTAYYNEQSISEVVNQALRLFYE